MTELKVGDRVLYPCIIGGCARLNVLTIRKIDADCCGGQTLYTKELTGYIWNDDVYTKKQILEMLK